MNSLLKHQVKKYLSRKDVTNEDLMAFIDAVNKSYDNFDDQYLMQQRALAISSVELSDANMKLKQETLVQRNLIDKLNGILNSLKLHELPGYKKSEALNLDGVKLAEFIEKQTQEIMSMNAQREKLLSELEAQNQELSDYAYLVSHDLKSPLRSIDTLTAWLNPEESVEKVDKTEHLKLIRDNVEKMDNLINGILNYSTINKKNTQICDLDLNIVMTEIFSSTTIPEQIEVNLPSKFPTIVADKYRITQLFKSLIDNAIKFNDKVKGLLEIGFSEEPNHWKFYVKDKGKGIDKNYFDKIFKPFQKLENDPSATGIGLSIAKKIVTAYDGKIWVDSVLGKGSAFYFTIKK
jgi:light-regulated signal transduction histidine kinase (bacteriophytochrome)